MIMKGTQTFLTDLPKLEMGDQATRPSRSISWKSNINQALNPVGAVVKSWWRWILQRAEASHKQSVSSSIQDRESVYPTDDLPEAWTQVDSWLEPKLLEAIPATTRDLVESRARVGCVDGSHLVLFNF